MRPRSERKDPFFGPALLLVSPGAAESGIETIFIESLFERLGFHHMRIKRRPGSEWIDASLDPFFIDEHAQINI